MTSKKKTSRATAIAGTLAFVGFVFWIIFFLTGGGKPSASNSWAPEVGKPALLQEGAIVCPDRKVLDEMVNKVAQANSSNDKVGSENAVYAAVLKGCIFNKSLQTVNVINIQTKGVDAAGFEAQIREKNALAYWVWGTTLVDPQKTSNTK